MPLLDHFHVALGDERRWESFHSTWPIWITDGLNQHLLPERYRAAPRIHFGVAIETDVATIDVARRTHDLDVFEVKVYDDKATQAFVAAIELVSPANKDRPSHRLAFVTKCAAYLQEGVSVIVVDVVTERRDNLHAELMQLLRLGEGPAGAIPSELYAVAYRTTGIGTRVRLEAWPAPLALGAPLPVLPLWLAPDFAVPLDLEASYAAACRSLRIR